MFAVTASAKEKIVPNKTVVSKKVDSVELKMHIFHPKDLKPTDKRPAILFFFGGGWIGGTPSQFYPHFQ